MEPFFLKIFYIMFLNKKKSKENPRAKKQLSQNLDIVKTLTFKQARSTAKSNLASRANIS